MSEKKKKIYVVGHRNPDSDSICSAICYAQLKNQIGQTDIYVAARAGEINQETRYILNRFGVEEPRYIDDVSPQAKDIEYGYTQGVAGNLSMKKAWNLMKSTGVSTLPILEGNNLLGLITIGDIATSYMDVYDSRILAMAHTPYINIVETLDGEIISGSTDGVFQGGKVLVAAANPDMMESFISEGDLVILGNRYESQLCAIEMGADCIVVCEGANVALTITRLAEEKNCIIIRSPHDTYTVSRLINQSIPISYFMRSEHLITFRTNALVEDIRHVMARVRHRDFPILGHDGTYRGMISRRNLLQLERKKVILVDHNEKNQAVEGIENADILEIIDHHRLGSIETMSPVYFRNQPLGCTATIVYQMYMENGIQPDTVTAGLLCAAILSDTLMFKSPTCTPEDERTARHLAEIAGVDCIELATQMFTSGSDLKGKSEEEIFYQDYKKFTSGDMEFGVGQISSMSAEELRDIHFRLIPFIEKYFYNGQDRGMIFFLLTNVMESSSELIYYGNSAAELVEKAFGIHGEGNCVHIKGLVSRKKQLIPKLMMAIQQEGI
jgi:manganese-dependent inorganic pyrophosphatase